MKTVPHTFQQHDFVGGDPALDFVNTVTARDSEPADWIADYAALLAWGRLSGIFGKTSIARLAGLAREEPGRASAALARCRTLREALCRVLYAFVREQDPASQDVVVVNEARLAAAKAARLSPDDGRLQAQFSVERSGLDYIAHVVAARAIMLLDDAARMPRLRLCDGHDCGWLFIDTSKNGRRRWCDMATCGNTEKARRHYERSKG